MSVNKKKVQPQLAHLLLSSGQLQTDQPTLPLSWTQAMLAVPSSPRRHVVQGVRYIVGDDDKEDVCAQPRVADVSWRNLTGIGLVPSGVGSSNGWAYDCDAEPSEDHPFGQFCTPFKNPEADDFPDDVSGYNSFDNILLSWIVVFQHVRALHARQHGLPPAPELAGVCVLRPDWTVSAAAAAAALICMAALAAAAQEPALLCRKDASAPVCILLSLAAHAASVCTPAEPPHAYQQACAAAEWCLCCLSQCPQTLQNGIFVAYHSVHQHRTMVPL